MTLVSPVKTNELRALEIPPTPWGEIDNLRFGGIEYFFYPLLELNSFFFTVTIGRRIIFFYKVLSFCLIRDSLSDIVSQIFSVSTPRSTASCGSCDLNSNFPASLCHLFLAEHYSMHFEILRAAAFKFPVTRTACLYAFA